MPWITARTWVSGETVTAAIMNAHVRDQLNLLKTHIDDEGELETGLHSTGFASGAGNVDAAETDLTGMGFVIPANFLADGEVLEIRATLATGVNANVKTLKFYPDSTNSGTILTATANNALIVLHLFIWRRTSTTVGMTGNFMIYPAGTEQAVSSNKSVNVLISSLDFTVSQTAKFTAQGTVTDDLRIIELAVRHVRGHGSLV